MGLHVINFLNTCPNGHRKILLFQVRVMERRLNEVDWTPTEISEKAEQVQTEVFERERIIRTLESEVEQQVGSRYGAGQELLMIRFLSL